MPAQPGTRNASASWPGPASAAGLGDGGGAVIVGSVVVVAVGQGDGQRTQPSAAPGSDLAAACLAGGRRWLRRLRIAGSAAAPAGRLLDSLVGGGALVHARAAGAQPFSRRRALLLAAVGAAAPAATAARAGAAPAQPGQRGLADDQCLGSGPANAVDGQHVLSLALAQRELVSHLQANAGESEADESHHHHDPSRGRGFAVGRAVVAGPRSLGVAPSRRPAAATQRTPGLAGDSRGGPQRHRHVLGAPATANLRGTSARCPPRQPTPTPQSSPPPLAGPGRPPTAQAAANPQDGDQP